MTRLSSGAALTAIRCPTLIIQGDSDLMIPARSSPAATRLNPRRLLRDTFTVHGTRDDAEARLAEYLGRARLGDRINEAAAGTFGELLDLWLERGCRGRSRSRSW
jgi:hypothetical protein